MLNKTVTTLRSSASTSITTLAFSSDSFKSPTRKKSKEREDPYSSAHIESEKNKRFMNSEIILIRKEKTVEKPPITSKNEKRLSLNSKSTERSDTSKSPTKLQLSSKKELKLLDNASISLALHPVQEAPTKSILKKKSCIRMRLEKQEPEPPKEKSVKFVDCENVLINDNNEEIVIPKKPLAEIISVESYRHYKIYAGSSVENVNVPEDDSLNKTYCRCACNIY
jgi:hypothetical protein